MWKVAFIVWQLVFNIYEKALHDIYTNITPDKKFALEMFLD